MPAYTKSWREYRLHAVHGAGTAGVMGVVAVCRMKRTRDGYNAAAGVINASFG